MTVEEVRERVAHIRDIAGDDEAAHCCEDNLWEAVLRFVAAGAGSDPSGDEWDYAEAFHRSQELAQGALTTKDIDFERWCA